MKDNSRKAEQDALDRTLAKYEAKTSPQRISELFAERGRRMSDRYRAQAEVMHRVHKTVVAVTDAEGLPRMMRFWYTCYGREVYRVWRAVPQGCQEVEYDVIRYKWVARGLVPELLDRVKGAVMAMLERADCPRKGDAELT